MKTSDISTYISKVQQVLQSYDYGQRRSEARLHTAEIQIITNFIYENTAILHPNAGERTSLAAKGQELLEKSTCRFLSILRRLSKADEGVSRQERIFLYQYWADLEKEFQNAPNALSEKPGS